MVCVVDEVCGNEISVFDLISDLNGRDGLDIADYYVKPTRVADDLEPSLKLLKEYFPLL